MRVDWLSVAVRILKAELMCVNGSGEKQVINQRPMAASALFSPNAGDKEDDSAV